MHLSRSMYSTAISQYQLFFNCLNFQVGKEEEEEEEGNKVDVSLMGSCTGWLFGTDGGWSNAEAVLSNFDEPLCGTGELTDGRQALV